VFTSWLKKQKPRDSRGPVPTLLRISLIVGCAPLSTRMRPSPQASRGHTDRGAWWQHASLLQNTNSAAYFFFLKKALKRRNRKININWWNIHSTINAQSSKFRLPAHWILGFESRSRQGCHVSLCCLVMAQDTRSADPPMKESCSVHIRLLSTYSLVRTSHKEHFINIWFI
jgi:hypothetical protein